MKPDLLLKILIAEYFIICFAYGWHGDWPRVMYFAGAIILSIGVLWMK